MIANPRFNAGRFRPPADDAVGVLRKWFRTYFESAIIRYDPNG
jgi:hypothetical protein